MKYLKFFVFLALFFVCMEFFNANMEAMQQSVTLVVSFLGIPVGSGLTLPAYIYLLLFAVGGAFFTALFFFTDKLSVAKKLRAAHKKIATLEKEVSSLRNLPLENNEAFPQQPLELEKNEELKA